MRALVLLLALLPLPAAAQGILAAATTLPAGTIISEQDLKRVESTRAGMSDPAKVIGMQTRITIYEDRPIPPNALQKPKLVLRNQLVKVSFRSGAIHIEVEGRALGEGGAGDVVRIMNLGSKKIINARVQEDGSLSVL